MVELRAGFTTRFAGLGFAKGHFMGRFAEESTNIAAPARHPEEPKAGRTAPALRAITELQNYRITDCEMTRSSVICH